MAFIADNNILIISFQGMITTHHVKLVQYEHIFMYNPNSSHPGPSVYPANISIQFTFLSFSGFATST